MSFKICVHCGAEAVDKRGRRVTDLFDAALFAKSRILRLVECGACGRVVDPYVEREGTLVLLDIGLQSQAVLRHVLVNSDHALLILKMVLLTIIVDGYCRWRYLFVLRYPVVRSRIEFVRIWIKQF